MSEPPVARNNVALKREALFLLTDDRERLSRSKLVVAEGARDVCQRRRRSRCPLTFESNPDISTWQRSGHFYFAPAIVAVETLRTLDARGGTLDFEDGASQASAATATSPRVPWRVDPDRRLRPHERFEDRGPRCTLLVFVDDATGRLMQLYFARSESTFDYFAATTEYVRRHGRPVAFYSDLIA
jgi:hypothetical protein